MMIKQSLIQKLCDTPPHACIQGEAGLHPRKLLKGSSSIFIDGCASGRVGDAIDCGGEASTGSFNVMFG
ncbi:hypothetical protein [Paenochrobactrum gallinarii]